MISNILSAVKSIVDFISLVFDGILDFFNAIPTFVGYITSMISCVPTCLSVFCGLALSVIVANKILSIF